MYDEEQYTSYEELDESIYLAEESLSETPVDVHSRETRDFELQNESESEMALESTTGTSIHNDSNTESSQVKRKKHGNVPKNVVKAEKRVLASLVEKEVVLWDLHNEHHSNMHALQAAWDRVAQKMPSNRSALDCKAIWKSLNDSLRYRRKRKMGKTGTSRDEAESIDVSDVWEFDDCMSFLEPMSTKYPRKTTIMGMESVTAHQNDITNDGTTSETASITAWDISSGSNYSYAVGSSKKDILSESVINMTKSVSDFVTQRISRTIQQPPKQFKFEHLWLYLDNLFDKMTPEQRDVLNLQYVAMAINILQDQ